MAAVVLAGAATAPTRAQITPTPGTATQALQTPNGVPQVNIAAPSGAGVSVNTYHQFDVQRHGAIPNNLPTLVNTQQAGYINGNPNLAPGQSARIIVNQVNSASASQLRGYVEVAGSRAEVVLANPNGIVVDGGGFINTSRATLATGQPVYGVDGALAGYHVSRGLITVQGAGLNAANVDQVDLIARGAGQCGDPCANKPERRDGRQPSAARHGGGERDPRRGARARGAIDARASGAVRHDRGAMSSLAGLAIEAGSVSNQGAQISAGGLLSVRTALALANQGGTSKA
jgi:filamentous hemagglutinin family protein